MEAVFQCCRNPAYVGKTIGIISLQGEAQAKLINSLLVKRLKPEEIEGREIVCGDAYAFQGDERDIMFLSMVAATNAQFQARTTDADRQRYNVAASRARDQVWLFHSVTLNDMNPADMRYKLLAYYSDPRQQPTGGPDWEKCESKFERAVGQIIHDRHYRVVPQFEPFGPNGKRIDFVIEGTRTRLAVECDGPHHDEPEQIVQDLARQRQLERCGWTFWRVTASAFYANPDASLESLWRKLGHMGIDPVGVSPVTTTIPSAVPAQDPPARLAAALRFAASRSQPTRAVQSELLPGLQVDLFTQPLSASAPGSPSEIPASDVAEETFESVVASFSPPNNRFLSREDRRRVIMAAIPRREKVAIRDVVRRVVEALDLEGAGHANQISEAIDRMVEDRLLVGSVTQVWRKPD